MWNNLSLKEKAELILAGVKAGYKDIDSIRERFNSFSKGNYLEPIILRTQEQLPVENVENSDYSVVPKLDYYKDPNEQLVNRFDKGGHYTVGNLVDAIYLNNPKEEYLGKPSHNYGFTQSEEWANAHGYYPDARGHRDDRVKKPAHPSHPSRGIWQGDNFILTDKGFEDPNYTLFGLNDGGQDPLATLIYDDGVILPEITVTPNSKYINNSYDNIRLHLKSNGGKINRFDGGGPKNITFYELANNPQYGFHLMENGKDGKPIYYNANTGLWFFASKTQNKDRLSEIKLGQEQDPAITNPQNKPVELPAVYNYISSQIQGMEKPITPEEWKEKLLSQAKEVFSYFPIIGEGIDVYDIGKDFYDGNYTAGLAGLSLMLLPEWLELGTKKGGKYFRNFINSYKTNVDAESMKKLTDIHFSNTVNTLGGDNYYHFRHSKSFNSPIKSSSNSSNLRGDDVYISYGIPWWEKRNNNTFEYLEIPKLHVGDVSATTYMGTHRPGTSVVLLGERALLSKYGSVSNMTKEEINLLPSKEWIDHINILNNNKLYNEKTPEFKNIYLGNLTTIPSDLMKDIFLNKLYNFYSKEYLPDGTPVVFKGINAGNKNNTIFDNNENILKIFKHGGKINKFNVQLLK